MKNRLIYELDQAMTDLDDVLAMWPAIRDAPDPVIMRIKGLREVIEKVVKQTDEEGGK